MTQKFSWFMVLAASFPGVLMSQPPLTVDVIVVGAGMAGLRCARSLVDAGCQVVVLDKSRGVGGRVATRRLEGTWADHGTCYLSPQGERFQRFLYDLAEAGVIFPWTEQVYEIGQEGQLQAPPPEDCYPRWVAPDGMTAIAKVLTPGLDIRYQHRVDTIHATPTGWLVKATAALGSNSGVTAQFSAPSLVLALPAPQIVPLLEPLQAELSAPYIEQIAAVRFLPCLSVMAGYGPEVLSRWQQQFPGVKALTFTNHPTLGWLGLDSSKRQHSEFPVFVIQSSATFAEQMLELEDLQPVAQVMLAAVAQALQPWFAQPTWFQIHRWRYAFAKEPLHQGFLAAPSTFPLVCAGDWCLGKKVESAYDSGLAAAEYLLQ